MIEAGHLSRHFPVHAIIGAGMSIRQLGSTLIRLSDAALPAPFDSLFVLERPQLASADHESLRSLGSRLCILRFKPNGMRIRGEFVEAAGGDVVMLGSAGVASSEELQRFGLNLNDFAAHDPTADFLMAVATHRASLEDIKRLTADLKRQKGQLELGNRQLAEATAEASRASEMKSRFLSHMSHELRTPLHAIAGLSRLLLDRTSPADREEFIASIHISAELLVSLVGQVLDLAKIEAGCQEIASHPFDPRLMIDEVMRPQSEQARGRGLGFVWQLSAPEGLWLAGDCLRIKQVLLNLVGNALKFTERGAVRLVAEWRDGMLRFEVRDSGPGLPELELRRLLQPFDRGSTSLASLGGAGLGLAIAHELAELMGGSITAARAGTSGSAIHFEVPAPRVAAPVRDLAGEGRLPDPRVVLIVDDNKINLLLGQKLLERDGHSVLVARGGVEAIALIESSAPDLVLMDLLMPGLDGLETTRELRRRGIEVPVIALTANATDGARETCLEAGMDDYLPKPLDLARLRDAFRMLEGRPGRPASAK
jgi:signal transduction histidine kinase/ActR/RegA family two-component response regulator